MDEDSHDEWTKALTDEELRYWQLLTHERQSYLKRVWLTSEPNDRIELFRLLFNQQVEWQLFDQSIAHFPAKKRRKAVLEKMKKGHDESLAWILSQPNTALDDPK